MVQNKIIRIDEEAYNLVAPFVAEHDLTFGQVVSELVRFGMPYIKTKEVAVTTTHTEVYIDKEG